MADIRSRTRELYALEQLAAGKTLIHRRHPTVKLLGCLTYLICLMSLDSHSLGRMAPFLLYPLLILALGEIPMGLVLRRTLVVLPFCLLAGLSNLILERQPVLLLGPLTVTVGMEALLAILLRAVLCVAAVLALIAVTPFSELTAALRGLHVPGSFVALLEMTYRYIGVLGEETSSMTAAYQLRGGGKRALEMRHMGAFVGSLLLRSFDRAQRVYGAMKCRGYGGAWRRGKTRVMNAGDWVYGLVVMGSSLLFRLTDIPAWIGGLATCWM